MHIYAKSIMLLAFGLMALLSIQTIPQKAYGDGIFQENVQAQIGDRKITTFFKLNPPIITSDNPADRYLYFRFFDSNNNDTIKNVSFFINATKGNQILMHDLFYTHDGYLMIKFQPGNCPSAVCTIYGDNDPILGGYGSQTNDVTVLSPILEDGGLYHFHLELFAMDYANTIINQTNPPKFDSYLSVGDVSNQDITYQNNLYNTTLISYYDKTTDLKFDESTKQFSWKMPFDWNVNRFQDRNTYIHEELRVPKSLSAFSDTPTYTASAEGFSLTGRRVIVDPYSSKDYMIVHLFINKPDLIEMAKAVHMGTNDITFRLAPEKPNVQSSASLLTDFGGWHIKLGWNPTDLTANSQNNLNISFYDSFTEKQVTGDVNYDIQILDKDQSVLWSKTDAVAQSGIDKQTVNLPGNGIYSIIVKVKSIVNNGFPDNSRIGMGRGNIVIPSTVTEQDSLTQSGGQPTSITPDNTKITGNNATVPEFPFASIILLVSIFSVIVFYKLRLRTGPKSYNS
jgi:hypothetical protein